MRKGIMVPVNNDVVQEQLRSSACSPATALRDLEWNNVQALIENGGTSFGTTEPLTVELTTFQKNSE